MPSAPLDTLLQRLRKLAPDVAADAARAEREAGLGTDVVDALKRDGFFHLLTPRSCGGLELPLPQALRIYEAAAEIDGSLGWAIKVGAGGGPFAAFLPEPTAHEVFRPDAVIAGSGAPTGKAEQVEGGYRVNGAWRFASGARYATTFTANCIVTRDGQPVSTDGGPLIRAMAFHPGDVRLAETWDTSGMRATGSLDFSVTDVFVPQARSFSLAEPPREPGPLYRIPLVVLAELSVAAVAVGLARRLCSEFCAIAAARTVTATPTLMRDDPLSQQAYARAVAAMETAGAALYARADALWTVLSRGDALGADDQALCSAVVIRIITELRAQAEELAALTGMQAIAGDNAFARARRDMAALTSHFAASPHRLVDAGAVLLQRASAT